MHKLAAWFFVLTVIFPGIIFCESSWKEVYNNPDYYFTCIKCLDSLNCFASASNVDNFHVILGSSDGGSSWYFSRMDSTNKHEPRINTIVYPAKSLCIALCDSGVILRTTDGGANWQKIQLPTRLDLHFASMADSLNGLIITFSELFVTRDAGVSWNKVQCKSFDDLPSDGLCGLYNVAMPGNNTFNVLALVSSRPRKFSLFRSEDSGLNWSKIDYPAQTVPVWTFVDSLYGWGCSTELMDDGNRTCLKSRIVHSSDGGKSWIEQVNDTLCPPYSFLTDIAFFDRDNGIAVGDFGRMIRTSDGGNSWFCESVDSIKWAYSYDSYTCFAGKYSVLVTSSTGHIFKSDDLTIIPKLNGDFSIYPNPSNGKITIRYKLDKPSKTRLSLINDLGVESFVVYIESINPGLNFYDFNPRDYGLYTGLYFLKIEAGEYKHIEKLILY